MHIYIYLRRQSVNLQHQTCGVDQTWRPSCCRGGSATCGVVLAWTVADPGTEDSAGLLLTITRDRAVPFERPFTSWETRGAGTKDTLRTKLVCPITNSLKAACAPSEASAFFLSRLTRLDFLFFWFLLNLFEGSFSILTGHKSKHELQLETSCTIDYVASKYISICFESRY